MYGKGNNNKRWYRPAPYATSLLPRILELGNRTSTNKAIAKIILNNFARRFVSKRLRMKRPHDPR